MVRKRRGATGPGVSWIASNQDVHVHRLRPVLEGVDGRIFRRRFLLEPFDLGSEREQLRLGIGRQPRLDLILGERQNAVFPGEFLEQSLVRGFRTCRCRRSFDARLKSSCEVEHLGKCLGPFGAELSSAKKSIPIGQVRATVFRRRLQIGDPGFEEFGVKSFPTGEFIRSAPWKSPKVQTATT